MKRTVQYALAAFLFGLIYDWVVVRYYQSIDAGLAWNAALISMELGFLGIGSLQAWDQSGRRFVVLAAEVVGMGVGTYAAVGT